MADPSTYRPATGSIPTRPGVYRFRDEHGRVIYVGKAKNLRQRLSNYFQDLAVLHERTRRMVTTAASVEWTVVGTEVEALTLEYTWIKEFDPRFNVKFRDDKSYPYLVLTMGEKVPRVQITRRPRTKSDRVFGPYPQVGAIRETLDLMLRVFPVRSCSAGVYRRAERSGRPCLLGFIGKCAAPCVGDISEAEHRRLAEQFADFMAGNTATYTRRIEKEMREAAAAMDYERAAGLRDDLQALTTVMEKNSVVLSDATDADLVGFAQDELEASVQVFHVRGGRIRGQRGWTAEILDTSTAADLIERALTTLYTEGAAPKEVLVPVLPTHRDQVLELIGRPVDLRIPQRGEKKDLLATVTENALEALRLHRLKRTGDITARTKALEDLGEALELAEPPLRIECFDISHSHGTNVVGSQVVFEDGLPKKSEYRRYSVSGDAARDDTASMYDVITRRLKHHLDPPEKTEEESRRFAYPPSLILVDGGAPQVAAAQRAFDELGITDIALAGIAKRLEEIWVPGDEYPVILPRTSEALFLVQRLRDEAHRFAITYHRSKRGRAMQASALDGITGLGPARRRSLLDRFVTVSAIRSASEEELQQVDGIGPALAAQILAALRSEEAPETDAASASATDDDSLGVTVDMATGEILDT
ncbi:excinuclease ABC subunit UvrC [Brachybacterium alimentarium]|uniref:UvrABC system protein C n=1 Tax=Brachybacterium alimentarium TaxID=47845 RepID=A0A2A3YMD4_9MICO|nr:excinuclease ABC subunit UvrC [Brachybacterium alimentarium]PCC36133.1 excinuclease ABC subunit C [Brachybacterium alimentarium]PCC40464.1 excinuclease ABC subunit C [Brachybacterium alimentarium]RCS68473.1 excinuclease ABC subunit UvrC [Brachybacterium alimentarium]RCS81991.1 excinuclease ABC subunit UvrC [Brachybacterium alimentarium]